MIKVYTAPSCSSCRKAKKFFNDENIPYMEKNIFVADLNDKEINIELRYNKTFSNNNEYFKWMHKAALQEYAEAQYFTGQAYFEGKGVEQNCEEGMKWYIKAAEQNYSQAMYSIGLVYLSGEGTYQKDQHEAPPYCYHINFRNGSRSRRFAS